MSHDVLEKYGWSQYFGFAERRGGGISERSPGLGPWLETRPWVRGTLQALGCRL